VSLPNYLARLRLDAKEVTPELLRLKFYCFWTWNFLCVCLFVLFPVCLSTTSPYWFLWFPLSFFFLFLFFFVLLVLLLWIG
jgi:hypothetical protein